MSQQTITPENVSSIIEGIAAEGNQGNYYNFKLKDAEAGQTLLKSSPEEQVSFVMAALAWLDSQDKPAHHYTFWRVRTAVMEMMKRRLPFSYDNLLTLLSWSIKQSNNYWRGIPQMIKAIENYVQEHDFQPELRERVAQLTTIVESEHSTAETRKWVVKLKEISGEHNLTLPLVPGEAWSDAAINDILMMDAEQQTKWLELLNVCLKASGSAPSSKWTKEINPVFERLGFAEFKKSVLKWFSLVDKPRTQVIETWSQYQPDPNTLIEAVNADLLRSLVWLCTSREDKELARALTALALSAYRKVPNIGPRCVRVGNACVWALGQMPGIEGTGQLALLKVRVKFGTAQKGIETALSVAAGRSGLPPEEIEELSVPTYGLHDVGLRREQLGEYTAELVVTGTSAAELRWFKPDGKRVSAAPKAVKDQHSDELKELAQVVKDIRKMLPAQSDRIENLFLEQKCWTYKLWRERYLDHPLVAELARRLIWKFSCEANKSSGIWHEGRIVTSDGQILDWLDEKALVWMWHPIEETTEQVMAWREWLTTNEVRQPFKQAHREIYLLTDAERNTRVYSNRFAAHIIKQHQFNALCALRGWKNKLRLMVDDSYPPATRLMSKWNLRAEFWIEGVGDNYGTDTTDAGSYLYLTTDQVRFYPIEARQNYAHAGGGGYNMYGRGTGSVNEPLTLEQIPPLVFSEIMRDVDMFVGVCSVANDPAWADGGPAGRYQNYWASYSFGELTETAKTRKGVLEKLIPKLKIADRTQLSDKFLVVRGDVRTYKIHLGSGNILMEPNDQYLCIVQARGSAAVSNDGGGITGGKVFLPFEGDNTLALILSKAFLLAEDWKITDATILRQIGKSD